MHRTAKALLLLVAVLAWSCSRPAQQSGQTAAGPAPSSGPAAPSAPAASSGQASETAAPPSPPAYESALPEDLRVLVDRNFTGDFNEMVKRRIIRIGAPFNRTFYFIDNGVQRGLTYEYLSLFEEQLNRKLNTGNLAVHVIVLPMARDDLIPQLEAGKIDMVVAQMTVTPERQKLVAFSMPTRSDVNEVLVTGPGAPSVRSFDDLKGAQVLVRKSSSYYASLEEYNRKARAEGRPQIRIKAAPENLEDDDLLEMVNAGLIPATVVDNYLADFWKQVFTSLAVHDDLTLRTGGNLAVAFRKDSPQLEAVLNRFIAANGLNTAFGRILNKRYLQNTTYVKDASSEAERKKFQAMADIFRKYGEEYRFDYLLMAAQGYQESRLNQDAKSHVGAIGVMQLMPKTGQSQGVGDIRQVDPNIHAGVKYMRFMRDRYYEGQPMSDLDKGLFTFASYNAGAGKIDQLRKEAAKRGLNPNVWFGNVERVASERIGRETVTYVSNIYKYYIAYKLITEQRRLKREEKTALTGPAPP
jgi:membrane-bound lytic murein transglycosylase MltF